MKLINGKMFLPTLCIFFYLLLSNFSSKNAHAKENENTFESFEKHKPDIDNPYLSDIQYKLIKTNYSFVAIGEIIKQNEESSSTTLQCLEQDEKNKSTQINNKDKGNSSYSLNKLLDKEVYNEDDENEVSKVDEKITNQQNNNDNNYRLKKYKIITPNLILEASSFKMLKDWDRDNINAGLESFLHTCKVLKRYPARKKTVRTSELIFGSGEDWVTICNIADKYLSNNNARQFFEKYFVPFLVIDRAKNSCVGSFTGYHELSIIGNLSPSGEYKYPLYAKPKGCKNSSTCPNRRQINEGSLNGMGLELGWVNSPFDLWKLQLQGSGIIILPNGNFLRVSFGGTNSHKSKNVWDYIHSNLPTKEFNQNLISQLLTKNNALANSIINYNPSYTFFEKNNNRFAIGGHRSALVPGRSIAVDLRYIPYGMPVWIQTRIPVKKTFQDASWLWFNRLVIAQDTGMSINGAVRADIFFGHGDKATYLANHTRFSGSYYMLIPNNIVQKIKRKE